MRRLVLTVVLALAAAPAAGAEPPPAGGDPVFLIKGRGWGHGVGMSQYGAHGFARHGWRHGRILAHYYPGTTLERRRPLDVRVLLAASRKQVVLSSRKPFRLVDARGRKRAVRVRIVLGPMLRGLRSPVRAEPGAQPLSLDGRPYRGALVVRARAGLMSVVNHVSLERYLTGVVPYEMPHTWHAEALRAQAVVARSYTLATMRPGKLFDLHDDQRSQVYGGVRAETPETNRAIGATSGKVLTWMGQVASTFYHSTSGGRTASAAEVWGGRLPYLRSVSDPYDSESPHHAWGPISMSGAELARKLGVARARDVVVERAASGRAGAVLVETGSATRRFEASDVRRRLDVRSTWLQIGVMRLDPQRGRALFGHRVELTGTARGLRAPIIQRLDSSGWRQVARVRPAADGTFRTRVRAVATARYRLAAERNPGPEVALPVTPLVRVATANGRVRGTVRPAMPNVAIQRRTGDRWLTVVRVRVDGRGTFLTGDGLAPGQYRALVEPARGFTGAIAPFAL